MGLCSRKAAAWPRDDGVLPLLALRSQPGRQDSLSGRGVFMTSEITIRVRYAETDRMGLLHHANYLIYFEQARTELLRQQGLTYRDMEDQGFFLVITNVEVKYRSPAKYDDMLSIKATV